MLIPVIKGKTPKQTALEKGWELNSFFPKLAALPDNVQAIIIFICDPVNNPVYQLSKEDKAIVLADYFDMDKNAILKIYDKCFTDGTKEFEACQEYISHVPDPIYNMYSTVIKKSNEISFQIHSIKIEVDKFNDVGDKLFDRLMKYQESCLKIGENMRGLESLLRSPEEKHLFEKLVKKTKSVLS